MLKKIISSKKGIVLLVIVPSMIFLFHAGLFRTWIIDDAGISFSYARNLAEGYGLVSQPGNNPVEGYSNFSWVLFLSPFFYVGLFHPILIPKIMSILIVLVSFIVLYKTFSTLSNGNRFIPFFILILIAINTSFVVWSTSGLETPLYVLLISILLFWLVESFESGKTTLIRGIILGIITGFIAITRPEGVIFFGIYPVLRLTKKLSNRKLLFKSEISNLLIYTVSFIILFGSFLVFRLVYFDDLFPNPYYVKGGPSFRDLLSIVTFQPEIVFKAEKLMTSVAGPLGNVAFIGLTMTSIYLISIRRFLWEHFVLSIFLIWGILTYLLLPYDWMGVFRFAIPFLIFFYGYAVILIEAVINSFKLKSFYKKTLVMLMISLFTGGSILLSSIRSARFARHPTVPFSVVAEHFGNRFNQYVNRLGVHCGSILLPDVGGTLYYSRLRVYDMGGLCDKTIAKTLGKNQRAFYNYVFEIIKPTFIHIHGMWTYRCKLDNDERFRRDYIPIHEYPDLHVKNSYGLDMCSGDYVRRDVIGNNVEALYKIRNEFY